MKVLSRITPSSSKSCWKVALSALLVLAATAAMTPAANADSYNFNWSGNGITTSGVIDVTATSMPGTYQITGISGTFADTNAGFSGTITSLNAAPLPTYTPGSTYFSAPAFTAGNVFSYDDLFYPGGDSPAVCVDAPSFSGGVFDIYGMSFNVGDYTVDLWSQGVQGGDLVGDSLDGVKLGNSANGISVTGGTSPVPEPSSLILLGTGFIGLVGTMRRKLAA